MPDVLLYDNAKSWPFKMRFLSWLLQMDGLLMYGTVRIKASTQQQSSKMCGPQCNWRNTASKYLFVVEDPGMCHELGVDGKCELNWREDQCISSPQISEFVPRILPRHCYLHIILCYTELLFAKAHLSSLLFLKRMGMKVEVNSVRLVQLYILYAYRDSRWLPRMPFVACLLEVHG